MITLESLKRRIQALFTTGLLKAYNDDPPPKKGRPSLPEIQYEGLDSEVRDKRENVMPYGFTHWPKKNTAEALLFAENGEKAHTLAICISDRWHRFRLDAEGEVAIYDDKGQYIHLSKDGIKIKGTVKLDGGLEVDGDVKITGSLEVDAIKLA